MIKNKEEALRLLNAMLGNELMTKLRGERRASRATAPLKQALSAFLFENTKLNQTDISWVLGYKFHEMSRYGRKQFYSRLEAGWEEYAAAWIRITDAYKIAEKAFELDYNA